MDWCLDCHRDPAPNLRPPREVTRRDWTGRSAARALAYGEKAHAGLGDCRLTPDRAALPYVTVSEGAADGEPRFYASAVTFAGRAAPLIGHAYDGRPVKLAGNPNHPEWRGATDAFPRATLLDLYDPDRAEAPGGTSLSRGRRRGAPCPSRPGTRGRRDGHRPELVAHALVLTARFGGIGATLRRAGCSRARRSRARWRGDDAPDARRQPHLGRVPKLHPGEAGRLADLAEALAGSGIAFTGGPELVEPGRRLNALSSGTPPPLPGAVKAVPRPDQANGRGWLAAPAETGFGGLLADDRGRGKTLQTLALLAKRPIEESAPRSSLLIVPASLARVWARRAAEVVPEPRARGLQGSARKALFEAIDAAPLVALPYPLPHRDHALLERDRELAIRDEARAVKNPASTAARRIRSIRARARRALTGTPMENAFLDLRALCDWLVPGLLGDRRSSSTTS